MAKRKQMTFNDDEFVLVPLKKSLADKICDIATSSKTDPTTVLNSGVNILTDAYFDAEKNGVFEDECRVNNLPVCDECDSNLTEVARELSDEEAKEMLLEELKEVIKTAHTVEINIVMQK